MSRQPSPSTKRIQEEWAGQEELLINDEKPRLQPLRLVSPKAEGAAHSQLASLVTWRLVGRLQKRARELHLTLPLAPVLRRGSDLRLSLPVHRFVDWNEKAP